LLLLFSLCPLLLGGDIELRKKNKSTSGVCSSIHGLQAQLGKKNQCNPQGGPHGCREAEARRRSHRNTFSLVHTVGGGRFGVGVEGEEASHRHAPRPNCCFFFR
jgi:hypothetical protein